MRERPRRSEAVEAGDAKAVAGAGVVDQLRQARTLEVLSGDHVDEDADGAGLTQAVFLDGAGLAQAVFLDGAGLAQAVFLDGAGLTQAVFLAGDVLVRGGDAGIAEHVAAAGFCGRLFNAPDCVK